MSAKSEKEEHLASKIEGILGSGVISDVRISTDAASLVGVKFDNSVEARIRFEREGNSFVFERLELSESSASKVLEGSPKFRGTDADEKVLAFCYNILFTDSGQSFLDQAGRYLKVMEDDRVEAP